MKTMQVLKKGLMKLDPLVHETVINALDAVNPSPLHRRVMLSVLTTQQALAYNMKSVVTLFKYANACLRLHNTIGKLPNKLKTKDIKFTVPICPKCKKTTEYELTFWQLYEMGVPVCSNCDENIHISDNVTIRKGE